MNVQLKKIAVSASLLLVLPITANADTETVADTTISITKEGLDTAANIFAQSVGSVPSTLNVGGSYVAILGTVGSIAEKVTEMAVDYALEKRCKSTQYSYDDSQNICESAPDFTKNKFCVSNTDNINGDSVRMELVKWRVDGHLGEVISVDKVKHKNQLCIDRPLGATFLEVYNSSNKKILSRPLPVDLFNGEYGGLVKNGKFYLKEKTNELHEIMGYAVCPDIMYRSPFIDDAILAEKCLSIIKEDNMGQDNGQYDALFTKTMKSTKFSHLHRSLPGLFDDEYILKNTGIDMKADKYVAEIGGLFILTNDTYAFIDPKVNLAQKINDKEIKVWNEFHITGHTVLSDNIVEMGYKIPNSLLLKKINETNGI